MCRPVYGHLHHFLHGGQRWRNLRLLLQRGDAGAMSNLVLVNVRLTSDTMSLQARLLCADRALLSLSIRGHWREHRPRKGHNPSISPTVPKVQWRFVRIQY